MNRLAIIATIAALGLSACQKGQDQAQADSTARDLTLAPTESTTAMRDVPDRQTNPPAAPPRTPPPAARPPAPPPRPATRTLSAGARFDVAANDTISSRTSKIGETFTAHVIEDVKNAAGQVVIPAGATISGKITEVKPAPNPRTPGTLTLDVTSVTVGGNTYPLDAHVDSLETVHKGRGVTTGDAAKVGAGAAAGAILGRVIGGNSKGTVIGGVVGGIAGAGVATTTKDSDIVLPAGAHIIVRLTKDLTVSGS
jgi:glycine zipper 2TM protein